MGADGRKDDQGKPDPTLMPADAEFALWRVLDFGAKKYAPENWRLVEDAKRRYLAAGLRHQNDYRRGSRVDVESGIHPLAHAIIDLIFVLQLELEEQGRK